MRPAEELRDWIERNPNAPAAWLEAVEALTNCRELSGILAKFAARGVDLPAVQAVAMRAYAEAWQDVRRDPGEPEAAALRDVRDKAGALLAALHGAERLRRPIAPLENEDGFIAWTDESADSLRNDPGDDLGARVSLPDLLRELRAECDRLMIQPKRQKGAIRDRTDAACSMFVIRAARRLQRDHGSSMPTALAELANALFPDPKRTLDDRGVAKILDRDHPKNRKPC